MNPLVWIEAIAYAIARGVTRAWLDAMRERATATEEKPDAADLLRKKVFADAVAAEQRRVQSAAAQSGAPQPVGPPPPVAGL